MFYWKICLIFYITYEPKGNLFYTETIKLRCIALHCIVLHCIALHCILLHCIVLHSIALYCIAFHCIPLHCIVLHCIPFHCISLHCIALHSIVFFCIVLYCIALYCIVLYSIALHCIVWGLTDEGRGVAAGGPGADDVAGAQHVVREDGEGVGVGDGDAPLAVHVQPAGNRRHGEGHLSVRAGHQAPERPVGGQGELEVDGLTTRTGGE